MTMKESEQLPSDEREKRSTPKVCILLSTYNGEKYIKTQIDSIISQKDVIIELVIRDDGSTDNTVNIIRQYGDQIRLIEGTNIGCEKSFGELLKYQSDADYYAFSDQDDFWLDSKVSTEINAIEMLEGPALAACNLFLCDENLEIKGRMHTSEEIISIRKNMSGNYLCNMHGCVLLWNRILHDRISSNLPEETFAHDVWVNTVANSIGRTVVLDEPYIKYRLHGGNVSGHASSTWERAKKGIRLYLGRNHPRRDTIAKRLLELFGEEMDHKSRGYDTIKAIADYKTNIITKFQLIGKNIIRNSPVPDRYLWALCVLLGKY